MSQGTSTAIPVLEYAPQLKRGKIARVVFRWLRRASIFMLVFISGVGAGYGIAWTLAPRHYVASTAMYFSPILLRSSQRSSFLFTQADLIRSSTMIAAAQRNNAAKSLATSDWTEAVISADVDRRTDLVWITAAHADPNKATLMNQAILDATVATLNASGSRGVTSTVSVIQPPRNAASLRPIRNQKYLLVGAVIGAVVTLTIGLLKFVTDRSATSASSQEWKSSG